VDTMRALVLETIGAELVARDLPMPIAGPGQVLVEIHASGVNPLDTKIRAGAAAHAQVTVPAVLGIDLAGSVAALGEGVTRFAVGDEVYGMTGGIGDSQGSLAEYAAVDARLLALKPKSLSMLETASLPLAAITAWEGLVDRAGVGAGDVVLVQGGAGGVGHIAIQLARSRGVTVFATGSERSFDVIREAGATPIDRATGVDEYMASATEGEGFDVVFDAVGGTALDDSFRAVRAYTGHVVSILGWGTHALAPLSFRGATYSGVFSLLPLLTGRGREHHGDILSSITELVDAGSIKPRLAPTAYTWASVEAAHADAASPSGAGKIVVDLTRD
jgi:NADPH2:quinone reductase